MQKYADKNKILYAKKREFAPGIPEEKPISIMPNIDKERIFEFGVHDHTSVRAGRHYDLRLGDPKTGKAYSWAIPSAKLPEAGKPVLAIPTFIHDIRYMDFEGIIGSDYGRGIVKLPHRGKAVIHYASPERTKFTVNINGKEQTFVLIKPGKFKNAYMLINVTPKEQKKEAQEYSVTHEQQSTGPQPPPAFSIGFMSRLPYYLLGAGSLEVGGSYAGKLLAKHVPSMQSKFPKLYKFLSSRRPSLITAGLIGAGAAAAMSGLDILRYKLRNLRNRQNQEVYYNA
ncbi:MAG: DNA polymerase ligase N-terminal domain-containing protein [candidate division WOR-3 bacterium]